MADVRVQFLGDATGVTEASKQTQSAVGGLTKFVQDLAASLKAAGAAGIQAFNEIKEGAASAATSVKEVGTAGLEAKESLMGIGEALIAAFAIQQIAEFSKQMAETAESVVHTAMAFGMSVTEVQRFNATLAGLGVPAEAGQRAMMMLDNALTRAREGSKQQAAAFKEIGVNINEPMSQVQAFNTAVQGLSQVEDPITKIGLARQIFGRQLQALAPILGVTKEQIDAVNASIDASGAVDETAVRQGMALAEAYNQNKIAMMGLGNTLTTALAPALTAVVTMVTQLIQGFVQSYKEGGTAKVILDALGFTFKVLASIIMGLVGGFTLLTGAIVAAYQAAHAFAMLMQGDLPGAMAEGKKSVDSLTQSFREFAQESRELYNMDFGKPPPLPQVPTVPKGGLAGGGDLPHLGGKGGGKTRTSEWEEQLHQQLEDEKHFFADSKGEELKFWEDKLALTKKGSSEQREVESKIYELRKSMAQDALSEQVAELDFKKEMARDDYATVASIEQQKVDLIKSKYGEQSRQYQDVLREQERMTQQHEDELVRMDMERIHTQAKAEEDAAQGQLQLAKLQLEARKAALQEGVKSGTENPFAAAQGEYQATLQAIQLEQQARAQIDQIHLQELRDEAAIQGQRPQEVAKILAQIKELEAKSAIDTTIAQQQAANDSAAAWDKYVEQVQQDLRPIQTAFQGMVQGMLTGHETFVQALNKAWTGLLDNMINTMTQMLFHWIATQIAQTAAHSAAVATQTATTAAGAAAQTSISAMAAMKQLMHAAVVAAGKAYSALAGIPIIGPALGAAAAAATFAAVLAFGSMASAEGGWDQVPADGVPTELHKDEMVLSAQFARPLRQLLTGMDFGNVGTNAAAASAAAETANDNFGGSDVHLHYAPTVHAGSPDLMDLIENQSREFTTHLNKMVRSGHLGGGRG